MKQISCVFLCGDRSAYGRAHLAAISNNFHLKAIVVADHKRWIQFRRSLSGGETFSSKKSIALLAATKALIKKPLEFYRERKHQNWLKSFTAPVIEINDANSPESIALIARYEPDILLSAAYPQIFRQELIDVAPRGAVNFHPSLLPRFRGAHPHYWCLATGEECGGVSAHYMTGRLDSGDLISQRSFPLNGLYYADLYSKIIACTPAIVLDVANFLQNRNARPVPQNESLATVFRNDREIHRRLDFQSMDSRDILNRIRAWGAYALHRGVRLYIERGVVVSHNRHMTNNIQVPPGIIVDISEYGVVVSTKDAFFVLETVKWGAQTKPFFAWVAKWDVNVGERLE